MSEKSLFFDSVGGDRKYNSSDFTTYFSKVLTDGIFPNPSTNLQVVANGNMTVTVKPGGANIKGYLYNLDENKIITIEPATTTRKDSIVVRWDIGQRKISVEYKQGIIEPTRTISIYELVLAEITVNAGASSISQSNIYDTRQITDKCGLVNSLIEADTTELFAGFEEGFSTWFNNIKGLLSTDQAGSLQLEIEDLQNNKTDKTTTNAIQLEINTKTDKTTTNAMQLEINNKPNKDTVLLKTDKNTPNGVASLDSNNRLIQNIDYNKVIGNPNLKFEETIATGTLNIIIYPKTASQSISINVAEWLKISIKVDYKVLGYYHYFSGTPDITTSSVEITNTVDGVNTTLLSVVDFSGNEKTGTYETNNGEAWAMPKISSLVDVYRYIGVSGTNWGQLKDNKTNLLTITVKEEGYSSDSAKAIANYTITGIRR